MFYNIFSRYYSKQLRDDKLKERRTRVAEERRREEQERLQHFGLANGGSIGWNIILEVSTKF